MDREGVAAGLFHVKGIPQTVIVGRDGVVKSIYIGSGRELALKERLAEELDELPKREPIAARE